MNSWGSKIVSKMLQDKAFMKQTSNMADLWDSYLDFRDDKDLKPAKKDKQNYVGLEIECFSETDYSDLTGMLLNYDLENNVQMTDDGSINADFGQDIELRCLFPEKKLKDGLKNLRKFLKAGKFGINDSCGLHVHLDMRNRDVEACYKKLVKFQDVMFGLVKPERWNNEYCAHTDKKTFSGDRYVAINKNSYNDHKTIEIRLHHATLDVRSIEKWINLLINILNSRSAPAIKSKTDALKWAKGKRGIRGYINKEFNSKWFQFKDKILTPKSMPVEPAYEAEYNGDYT